MFRPLTLYILLMSTYFVLLIIVTINKVEETEEVNEEIGTNPNIAIHFSRLK